MRIDGGRHGDRHPRDAQDRIFDCFAQADGSTTRKNTAGPALASPFVKQLVGLMGGHIEGPVCPGQGSTFWFTISVSATTARDGCFKPKPLTHGDAAAPTSLKKETTIPCMSRPPVSKPASPEYPLN